METIDHSAFAELYDSYVTVQLDIPFFLEEAKRAHGPVLELMAGTGRVSLPLIQAGVELTCVDYSERMLAVLQSKLAQAGLTAAVYRQDIRLLDIQRSFDLILLPFHSLAEILAEDDRLQALKRIRQHLAPGGVFICTLHNPAIRLRQVDGQLRLWGDFPLAGVPDRLLLWGREVYDPQSSQVSGHQFFEIYDEGGFLKEKRLLATRFAIVGREAFEDQAQRAGLRIIELFGSYERAPFQAETSPFMIWRLESE